MAKVLKWCKHSPEQWGKCSDSSLGSESSAA